MNWYLGVLQKYAEFNGRAGRQEYWMFFLFNIIIAFGLGISVGILQSILGVDLGFIAMIYQLAILIPSIAVGVRRMHDTDRSGWWLIVPIAGFVFLFLDGHPNSNRFGADPKAGLAE
ncbi:MAG: DUF805 domain-containing protein [Gallionella sp.]